MAKARRSTEVRAFTDIPNVGKAMARDFATLGIATPADLRGRDAHALYRTLCERTGVRQDPCVLDTFLSVVDFMDGGEARPWWAFTTARKDRWPDL